MITITPKRYALTVTKNKREGYTTDRNDIFEFLKEVVSHPTNKKCHAELSDPGFEIQKVAPHRLHAHLTVYADKMPYLKPLMKKFPKINSKIVVLKNQCDQLQWLAYCHKHKDKNIQDLYEDSIVVKLPNLISYFKKINTPQVA